jgi:nicotinate-nucleotide--dimethylbenzimidazole phosphoribosyltransferase
LALAPVVVVDPELAPLELLGSVEPLSVEPLPLVELESVVELGGQLGAEEAPKPLEPKLLEPEPLEPNPLEPEPLEPNPLLLMALLPRPDVLEPGPLSPGTPQP